MIKQWRLLRKAKDLKSYSSRGIVNDDQVNALLKQRGIQPRDSSITTIDATTGEPIGNTLRGGQAEGTRMQSRAPQRIGTYDPLELVMPERARDKMPQDFLEALGIPPVKVEQLAEPDLTAPRFTQGGKYGFSGGGYVKKYDDGGKVYHDAVNKSRVAVGLPPLPEGSMEYK